MAKFEYPNRVPNVKLMTRVRDEMAEGPNPFKWAPVKTKELFANRRVVLFALPGAFTPTCSNQQLPGYERLYKKFIKAGVDEVFCLSVNDAFVMYQWGKAQKIKNVKLLPDGNGVFTQWMGADVKKDNLGFGWRSWRYAMVVDNGKIVQMFAEPGFKDNAKDDPYGVSAPENVLEWVTANPSAQTKKAAVVELLTSLPDSL